MGSPNIIAPHATKPCAMQRAVPNAGPDVVNTDHSRNQVCRLQPRPQAPRRFFQATTRLGCIESPIWATTQPRHFTIVAGLAGASNLCCRAAMTPQGSAAMKGRRVVVLVMLGPSKTAVLPTILGSALETSNSCICPLHCRRARHGTVHSRGLVEDPRRRRQDREVACAHRQCRRHLQRQDRENLRCRQGRREVRQVRAIQVRHAPSSSAARSRKSRCTTRCSVSPSPLLNRPRCPRSAH